MSEHYESEARDMIDDIHGETQWTQEIEKPAYAIAILCVLMDIRDEIKQIREMQEGTPTS